MKIPGRKYRVDRLVKTEYWDGFFARLGQRSGPDRPLEYYELPRWYNEVADIAYKAGWLFANETLESAPAKFGRTIDRTIPGAVYAEAYGAARLG